MGIKIEELYNILLSSLEWNIKYFNKHLENNNEIWLLYLYGIQEDVYILRRFEMDVKLDVRALDLYNEAKRILNSYRFVPECCELSYRK